MGKRRQDPVEVNADGSADLYEISTWEPRSRLDRFAHWLYYIGIRTLRYLVILAAVLILLLQVAFGSLGALSDQPLFAGMAILSAVPAFGLAAYIYYADVTTEEPLTLLVGTFLLGVLFAGFAGILNGFLGGPVQAIGSGFGLVPFLGQVFVFFLIVGPVEETVKLLAVRLYAFRDERFDTVVDGAVYGAVAGLGFATIENALYITQNAEMATGTVELLAASSDIATVRALAGPGHVIYSAFAGYYLGLAKFNPDDAGPIILKGLIIAAAVHATYNTFAGPVTGILSIVYGVDQFVAFLAFVVVYDGVFVAILLRKLQRYRQAFNRAHDSSAATDNEPKIPDIDP